MSPTMAPEKHRKKKRDDQPAEGQQSSGKDRHASRTMVRLQQDVHRQLKKLAERNSRPLTWELRLALIHHLEEAGLWPPGPEESGTD